MLAPELPLFIQVERNMIELELQRTSSKRGLALLYIRQKQMPKCKEI
jgi:hypothetical protein